ncbi:MAG: polysaccharide biosynthesis protein [Actinobacteria bacterium]|nr:polysaccharide biosynthesis protein [Actinomycetota bacterium]
MKRSSALKIIRLLIFDIAIIFSSFIISFFLRGVINISISGTIFSQYSNYIGTYVLIIIFVKIVMFVIFGMYRRVWKYASIKDMVAIVEAVTLSIIVMGVIFYVLSQPVNWFGRVFVLPYFPRSILIIDYLMTLLLVIISRFSERFFNELRFGKRGIRKKRVLIVGAGDAGEMIVREMIRQRNSEYIPIGFLDDDRTKLNNHIHGIKVLGPLSSLEDTIQKFTIDEILVAMPSVPGMVRKDITLRAKGAGVICKTSPSLYEVIDGKVYLDQIRDIGVEDILGREPIKVKITEIASEFKDNIILITGAGGSIGTEICRQLLRFGPSKLIIIDHSENNLFLIEEELKNKFNFNSLIPIVADIREKKLMSYVFKRYRPSIVFHTAAYKHVPLMQLNPDAAVRNNYLGTKILAKTAIETKVKRFVMLSTDKAVKPKNVMGISKLLAERYLQSISKANSTKFMIVRFGNVLESHGSVVNIFKEQISSGGPVKITHPKMNRYLMTIPEASQLAIQACIMGSGGEVYVLNMGEPINILDLATNMIKLYGMEPNRDIEIIYTGPREGEKITEEIICEDEILTESRFKHIFEAKCNGSFDREELSNILFSIEKEIETYDYRNLFKDLRRLIPDFNEKEMWYML